jgi:drug/metabolite transporter (DMT)-like permease
VAGTFLVILACLFWGVDTLIRYPLVERGINPVNIVFYEHLLLTVLFSWGALGNIKKMGELRLGDFFSFLVIGGLGSAVATVCFTQSFQYLNPSLVILLQKFQPLVVIFLSYLILGEKIQKEFLLWALVCLIGGFLISFPDIIRFYELIQGSFETVISDHSLLGHSLVGISILGWGSTTVFGKRLSLAGFSAQQIMSGRYLTGLIVLIPLMNWKENLALPYGEDYLRIMLMVLLSGALAMWLYYLGLKRISAKSAAIAEMFFPLFAIIANWIFLNKQLTQTQILGGVILIFGSLIIQLKKF